MCILRFRLYNIDKSIGEYDISESEKIVLWKAVSYKYTGIIICLNDYFGIYAAVNAAL